METLVFYTKVSYTNTLRVLSWNMQLNTPILIVWRIGSRG